MLKLLLISLCISNTFAVLNDDDLPVYLRGINWGKVEEYARTDLRLSAAVYITNYVLDITINARGYDGAKTSSVKGSAIIELEVLFDVNTLELHSNRLKIKKAEIVGKKIDIDEVNVTRISTDFDRETITVHLSRNITSFEKYLLSIDYEAHPIQNEYGMYEIWNPSSENDTGHYVLATRNFPTGSRFWFPCFDEPYRKATFNLRINHPKELNVFSNSKIARNESISATRNLAIFETTERLPTYLLSLTLNNFNIDHYTSENVMIRIIATSNSLRLLRAPDEPDRFRESIEIIPRILRELGVIDGVAKKTIDLFMIGGVTTTTVTPGVIVTGHSSDLFKSIYVPYVKSDEKNISAEFVQAFINNHQTISGFEELYLTELYSYYVAYNSITKKIIDEQSRIPENLFSTSHQPHRLWHRSTSSLYLNTKSDLRAKRAAQAMQIVSRLCPAAKENIKIYFTQQKDFYARAQTLSAQITKNCTQSLKSFFRAFTDHWDNKLLLTVSRNNTTVTIKQRAFRSNEMTYLAIPFFYTTDAGTFDAVYPALESEFTLPVDANSLFYIDQSYDHLYHVNYENPFPRVSNITESLRAELSLQVRHSLGYAVECGYIGYDKFISLIEAHVEMGILDHYDTSRAFKSSRRVFELEMNSTVQKEEIRREVQKRCTSAKYTNWDIEFNRHNRMGAVVPLSHPVDTMACMEEWNNSTNYKRFLKVNFVDNNLTVRPENRIFVPYFLYDRHRHWEEFSEFMFEALAEHSNPSLDYLTSILLSTSTIDDTDHYPHVEHYNNFLAQLHNFVRNHPKRAASISYAIAAKLEREFVRVARPKQRSSNVEMSTFEKDMNRLEGLAINLKYT